MFVSRRKFQIAVDEADKWRRLLREEMDGKVAAAKIDTGELAKRVEVLESWRGAVTEHFNQECHCGRCGVRLLRERAVPMEKGEHLLPVCIWCVSEATRQGWKKWKPKPKEEEGVPAPLRVVPQEEGEDAVHDGA